MGLDAALQARLMVDVDNPTVEGLQTLLLLSQAYFAYGLGKKAYMVFCKTIHLMQFSMLILASKLRCYGGGIRLAPRSTSQD